jgi:hypothetical protein
MSKYLYFKIKNQFTPLKHPNYLATYQLLAALFRSLGLDILEQGVALLDRI